MWKSDLKAGGDFYFLSSRGQKFYKNWRNEIVFVYILGFIFYSVSGWKSDLYNIYTYIYIYIYIIYIYI